MGEHVQVVRILPWECRDENYTSLRVFPFFAYMVPPETCRLASYRPVNHPASEMAALLPDGQ